jgi:Kdo2-lipid IVA lauroyltransferase/acyltransferase
MAYLVLRSLSLLPLPVLHALGIALGWLIWLWPGRHQDRLRENLAHSGLTQGHPGLLRQVIHETGKSLLEVPAIWLRPQEKVIRLVRDTPGLHHFEQALQTGRGVVVVAPHIGCFEIINQFIAARQPFTAMYKPARKPLVDAIMRQGRERGQARLVPTDRSGVKALLGALRRGEAIGVLPDQVATQGDGVWAPFFGRWAYTPTMTVRLIQSTGAIPLMAYAKRLSWGRGYRIHFDPLAAPLPQDRLQAAAALNREVERVAKKHPAQYMWSYARYKRPGGAEPAPDTPAA